MKTEPVIFCKYKDREKSIVLAAVEQPDNNVVLFFKAGKTIVGKNVFKENYLVVPEPVEGLSYAPQGLPKVKVAKTTVVVTPKAEVKTESKEKK